MDIHFDILPEAQKELWNELNQTPKKFVLYGGTALALQLGHRDSIDFDFFSSRDFDPEELLKTIPYLKNAGIDQLEKGTLSVSVKPTPDSQRVHLSFFHVDLPQIKAPKLVDNTIRVASIIDVFGMKCATISQRVERKDYLDINAIIKEGGYALNEGLGAAQAIYGRSYIPETTLRALSDTNGLNLDDKIIKEINGHLKALKKEKLPLFRTKSKIGRAAPNQSIGLGLKL